MSKELEKLESIYDEFDVFDPDADRDSIYRYAEYLYYGTSDIPQDKEKAEEVFAMLFVNLYQSDVLYNYMDTSYDEETDSYVEEFLDEEACKQTEIAKYKDVFLGAEYFTRDDVGPNDYVIEIAEIIQKGIPGVLNADPKRAFNLACHMPYPIGMIGGFDLVQAILSMDRAKLFLGDCYMRGLGVKQDYWEALINFVQYHSDHLAQKWHSNLITNQFDELYERALVAKDAIGDGTDDLDAQKIYSVLAYMTIEGLGCIANPRKAAEYLDTANELSIKTHAVFPIDRAYLDRLLEYDAKPYTPGMKLEVGDHIYLGKYNHRSVSWKVLNIEDGKALVLSDDVLESSYIVKEKCFGDWSNIDYLVNFNKEDCDDLSCFYLSKDMVEKFLPDPDDRICYYRNQALKNSTDEEEWGNGTLAGWWLFKEGEEDSEVRSYVDEDGDIYEEYIRRDYGIRPAMFVKVSE